VLRFSVNISLLFKEVPLLERISAARLAGFEAVEIQFPYAETIDNLLRAQQENQLPIVLINVPAGDLMSGGRGLACVLGKEAEFRQALAECKKYASQLQIPVVNVLAGRAAITDEEIAWRVLENNLRIAATELGDEGITVVVEAINNIDMANFLLSTDEQMLELIDRLSFPNLAMQYDIYHMTMMGSNPVSFLKAHMARVGHIQFADVPGRGQPGTGGIDFQSIFQLISESQYSGWVGAEYNPVDSKESHLSWFKHYSTMVGN